VQVIGIDSAISISAGGAWLPQNRGNDFYPFNCAVLRDGRVQCWGRTPEGGTPTSVPVFVPGLQQAVAVAGGHTHACALLKDGSIQCWGSAEWRSPSNGSTATADAPSTVLGIGKATAVVGLGATFSCAASTEGSVECWGLHTVASGVAASDWTPLEIPIAGAARATRIAAGYERACAVLSDGGVQCWHGLGSELPVTVPGLHSAIAVSVGRDHSCALAKGGTIECWGEKELGNDAWGQIGDRGFVADDRQPVTISGIRDAIAVSAGDSYTCCLLSDGSAWCWGNNRYGQLGDGAGDSARRDRNITPVRVRGF